MHTRLARIISNPSDGDAAQLRVTETQQECSIRTLEQPILRLLLAHKPNNQSVLPRSLQPVLSYLNDGIEPLPECEVPTRQRLLYMVFK